MRGVADGKGRGDESEEGECEVDGIVQEIAVVALFEGQYRRHKCFLQGSWGGIRMGLRRR
jgi:hypothetical protein